LRPEPFRRILSQEEEPRESWREHSSLFISKTTNRAC
jgi:hypothetical protein